MPYLLSPGPLTTARATKIEMLADWGAGDAEFRALVAGIRKRLLELAGCGAEHACVILPGSGSFALEAALGCFAPAGRRKTLVAINGEHGERAGRILERIGRPWLGIDRGDSGVVRLADLLPALDSDRNFTHVFLVHCETASGAVNDVSGIAQEVKARGRVLMVDAIACFGVLPLDMAADGIGVALSSSHTCVEGVPGFCFVLCRRDLLEDSKGRSHSLVLDLYEQWQELEKTGRFRFTPPTHALAAFAQALRAHAAEGGVEGRGLRCRDNARVLVAGMRALGFETLLPDELAGPVIQTFLSPADASFALERFCAGLRARGFAISPGRLAKRASFRIGTVGALDDSVMEAVLRATKEVLAEMKVTQMKPLA